MRPTKVKNKPVRSSWFERASKPAYNMVITDRKASTNGNYFFISPRFVELIHENNGSVYSKLLRFPLKITRAAYAAFSQKFLLRGAGAVFPPSGQCNPYIKSVLKGPICKFS